MSRGGRVLPWHCSMLVNLGERSTIIQIETSTPDRDGSVTTDSLRLRLGEVKPMTVALECAEILAREYEQQPAQKARLMVYSVLREHGVEATWAWGSTPGEKPPKPAKKRKS